MKKKSKNKPNKASGGKEYIIIAYSFVAIFMALILYLVYFNVELREEYANSPYNSKRQGTYKERVIKGDIVAAGGEILASTETNQEGEEKRVYPYHNVFAHVVGYSDSGISGLEQSMNSRLLSSHANLVEQVEKEFRKEKNTGDTVVTTLDVKLQQTAYDALGNHKGAVVVLEPDTGKILAMVSKPDFDPNTIRDDWEEINNDTAGSRLINRGTQGQYPPGSIFKIVTSLAYWREHQTLNDFSFDCTGEVEYSGHTIHCYHNSNHGQEDFATAFAKSCNGAFAMAGLDIKKDVYQDTAESLLFNQSLPVNMESRRSKFELTKASGDPLTMQTAIGQGNTLVSPMHMAMITAAIANGGNMMKPYLVERVESYTGVEVESTTPEVAKKAMTATEAEMLKNLMAGVITNGTASSMAGHGYTVAGKTGTAEHGNVSETTPHSWFVGFSNVENPDIVVSVIAEEAGAGSEVAVPIASKIFDAYYNN